MDKIADFKGRLQERLSDLKSDRDTTCIPHIWVRETFFNEYHLWLKDHNIRSFDCSRVHGDAAVQKELMDVGIPMRSEKNNPSTWRYQFFSKDCTLKSKLIACVALPLCQLPDFVQASFSEHFGEISGQLSLQRPSETSRSRSEGGKPL